MLKIIDIVVWIEECHGREGRNDHRSYRVKKHRIVETDDFPSKVIFQGLQNR